MTSRVFLHFLSEMDLTLLANTKLVAVVVVSCFSCGGVSDAETRNAFLHPFSGCRVIIFQVGTLIN